MNESQTSGDCNASTFSPSRPVVSFRSAKKSVHLPSRVLSLRISLRLVGSSLALAALFLTGCGDEPAPKPAAVAEAKPAEPAIPEDVQAAAQSLLGKETQVLIFGDLARNGKQQFLAANVVPKTPKNQLPGTIVTRAVIAESEDGKWTELFRCDEYLKNAKGYLAMTPLTSVGGWRVQYEQDPVKGLQLYVTPIKGAIDPHQLPIGVAWNPANKRYQSLDRTYEHFLMETPSLESAHSVLK